MRKKRRVFNWLLNVAKQFVRLIYAGKLFYAAGPATANARFPYGVFDVHFSFASLPAVDTEVKVDIDDDRKVERQFG